MPHALFILQALRSGSWLDAARLRRIAGLMLVVNLLGLALLLATSHPPLDSMGRPLGSDYADVYAAGRLALEGHPAEAWDPAPHYQMQQRLFGAEVPFYGWHYPPYFLLLAAPLAALPYLLSLFVWQGASLVFFFLAMARLLAPLSPLLRLGMVAFPAIAINLTHGHNGLLTAGLLAFGLQLLNERREFAAGLALGLLCYKPHFALLLPLALLAGGYWRCLLAAALMAGMLTLGTLLAFGTESWAAFLHFSQFTRAVVLESGDTGWYKIQSLFAAIRAWGGSVELAYACQLGLTLLLAGWLWRMWRQPGPFAEKAAALCLGVMLGTPYALDYDLMILAPGLAFAWLAARAQAFLPWEKTLLAANWAAPFFTRVVAMETRLPLALLLMLGWLVLLLRARERRLPEVPTPAPPG